MKIVFIIPNLKGGGAEKVFINIANEASKKHEVFLVVIDNAHNNYLNLINDRVKIKFLNESKTSKSFFKILNLIRSEKIEIVYSTLSHLNILLCLIKSVSIFYKFKLVVRETNYNSTLKYKILKLVYIFSDKIIYPSQELLDLYALFKYKSICINNPISKNILKQIKQHSKFTDFFKSDTINLVSVGSLTKQKDHRTLIKAISFINNNNKIRLIIIGDGPEYNNIKKLINLNNLNQKIKLIGFTNNPYAIIKEADAFILPSKYEGFPNALVEAVVLNKVCIVSKFKTGRIEILKDYNNFNYSFKIGDYEELSRLIINIKKKAFFNLNKEQYNKYNLSNITNQYLKKI